MNTDCVIVSSKVMLNDFMAVPKTGGPILDWAAVQPS